jgi:hypothetical protein
VTGDHTPEIRSIVPSDGPWGGGQTVTINGARFTSNTTFRFGYATATTLGCSASSCTVITPPANAAAQLSVTVPVKATANGIDSSWDGFQDNYTFVCAPKTCSAGECGSFNDGCGGTINCGCAWGQVCTWQQTCCAPLSAAQACGAATCGSASDGCGGSVTCGPPCPCTPLTCADLGGACGNVSNGCGGTITCGCPKGNVCQFGQCVTHACHTPAQCCVQQGGVWTGKFCE